MLNNLMGNGKSDAQTTSGLPLPPGCPIEALEDFLLLSLGNANAEVLDANRQIPGRRGEMDNDTLCFWLVFYCIGEQVVKHLTQPLSITYDRP